MDHTVVTIYCCGTAFHRDRIDSAVPYTWRCTAGSRVWMNDGPGNTSHHILKTEQIMKKVEGGGKVKDSLFENTRSSAIHQLTGDGSQDNIVTTLQWLWMEYYRKDKPKFNTINLCGWSRGAVTCIMLAHAVQAAGFPNLISNLKVNMFNFDPVPGGLNDFESSGDFDSTGRAGSPDELADCVHDYVAVLAENVGGLKGKLFHNVSPRIGGDEMMQNGGAGPKKTEYPMPGSHSGVVKHEDPSNSVGKIAISLCHTFMMDHGTSLIMNKALDDRRLLELYAKVNLEHGKESKGVLQKSTAAAERAPRVENSMRDSSFFVNGHHWQLFKTQLPQVYSVYASGEVIDGTICANLKQTYPDTHFALQRMGLAT